MSGFSPVNAVGDTIQSSEIDAGAVTYAKIQNISATDKILGRSTAGAGVTEEIACTAAGRALIDDASAADQRTTLGVATAQAYTQTYATADRTHANLTSADIGAFTGGVVGFLDAAELDNVRTQVNALRADLTDLKQLVNALVDDLQTAGIVT